MDDDSSGAERFLNGGSRRLSSNGHGEVPSPQPHTETAGEGGTAGHSGHGSSGRRRLPLAPLVGGLVMGAVLALIALLALAIAARRSAAPAVTTEDLRAAIARWRAHGPRDYDLVVETSGKQTGRYEVRVREGQPVAARRNGLDLKRREASYWTVPSLLDVIQHDLKFVDDPQRGFNAPPGSTVILRAEFDPELGLPRSYQRSILGQASDDVQWRIAEFQRVAAGS